jgi:predicted lipase
MNLQDVLQAGKLLQAAYHDDQRPNYDNQSYEGFTVLKTIYANNLATDLSKLDLTRYVSIGFIAQNAADAGEFVIVIRGTVGIAEWIQDAKLLPIPFSAVPGAGFTEDGFTDMYNSFRLAPDASTAQVVPSLAGILGGNITKLTICGHSLGSALATLLALDTVVHTAYTAPHVITFASPRVGDLHFSNYFNHAVPNCDRIVNRKDLVPKLPPPPLFIHVGDETELNPGSSVADSLVCQHAMDTYMFLLDPANNPLDQGCQPKPA